MFDDMTNATFSFLASGPSFQLQIPSGFIQVPELGSAVYNGIGSRKFVFLPWDVDQGTGDGSSQVDTVMDKDSRQVQVLQRPDDPPLWWLVWSLGSGGLYSHLREEEGQGYAASEVSKVSILETPGPAPYLLLDAPLAVMTNSAPGYQDRAVFYSSPQTAGWSIALSRPSFLAPGQVVQLTPPGASDVVMRAGTSIGLEILVNAPSIDDASRLLSAVIGSLEIV